MAAERAPNRGSGTDELAPPERGRAESGVDPTEADTLSGRDPQRSRPESADTLPRLPSASGARHADTLRGERADSTPPPDERPSLVGTLLADRYRVTGRVGRGGMGVVYRAEHVHMRKPVAIKVLHRELTWQHELVARFEREAIAAARIDNPHVVMATDFGRLDDGSLYLVLEFVEGRDLASLLEEGAVPELRAAYIARQICEALAAAHACEVVHRDLKPENVMLVPRESEPEFVKVLDFGIAKVGMAGLADEPASANRPGVVLTQSGVVFGTPHYMAPEQAVGQTVDHRADLYTVGVMLYEMLVGHTPFAGDDLERVLTAQIKETPPALPSCLNPKLARLAMQQLAKDPDDRVQDARLLCDRFDEVILELGGAPIVRVGRPGSRSDESEQLDLEQLEEQGRLSAPTREPPPPSRQPQRVEEPPAQPALTPSAPRNRALIAALLVAATALLIWRSGERSVVAPPAVSAAPVASVVQAPPPVAPSQLPAGHEVQFTQLFARAAVGDEAAMAELTRRPPAARSAQEWVALGRGSMALGQHTEALTAYQRALDQDASLAQDPILLSHVYRAANDAKTAQTAIKVAAYRLGSAGADIVYDVWVGTKKKTAVTQLAKQLVYSPDVRKHVSPALEVALDLRSGQSCRHYKQLLPRVTLSGDMRAFKVLVGLRPTHGCGPGKRSDCWPCMREDSALEDALNAIKFRDAPKF